MKSNPLPPNLAIIILLNKYNRDNCVYGQNILLVLFYMVSINKFQEIKYCLVNKANLMSFGVDEVVAELKGRKDFQLS